MICNDILDIGSSKNRRRANGFLAPPDLTLGRPGQFDLPNVSDVRSLKAYGDHDRRVVIFVVAITMTLETLAIPHPTESHTFLRWSPSCLMCSIAGSVLSQQLCFRLWYW
jgi:hypothetical protein